MLNYSVTGENVPSAYVYPMSTKTLDEIRIHAEEVKLSAVSKSFAIIILETMLFTSNTAYFFIFSPYIYMCTNPAEPELPGV
jgi:hypothetical protein